MRGNAIFGKSYLQIAAALRNYEESQKVANEVIARYGKVTDEAAGLADAFGDKLNVLGEGSKRALLNGLVPGLAAVNTGLDQLTQSGGTFMNSFGQVVSWLAKEAIQVFIGLAASVKAVGVTIGAVIASITTRSLTPLKELWTDLDKIEIERVASAARVEQAYAGVGRSADGAADQVDKSNRKQLDARAIAALLAPKQKDVADAYDALIKRLQNTIAATANYSEEQKLAIDLAEKKYDTVTANDQAQRALAIRLAQTADMIKYLNEVDKEHAENQDDVTRALERADLAYDGVRKTVIEMVAKLELEADAVGMTNAEREISIRLLELERAGIYKNTAEYDTYAVRIRSAIDKKELLTQQIDLWKRVESSAHDAFMSIFESGRNVFERLRDALKATVLELLYQMTVKRWVISIGASVSGLPEQALANGIGGGNAGGLLNMLAGGGSGSLLGLGGVGGLFSGSGGIFGAGAMGNSFALSGTGQALGLSAAGLDAAGGLALTELGVALGAAVPWAAVAAIAVPMILELIQRDGGGPKEGGAFSQFSGFNLYPGETTLANNGTIEQIVTANAQAYQQIARALGVTGNVAQFGLSYDTDPQGTAPNRVSAGALLNGQSVYSVLDRDVGRDAGELQAAIALEGQRAILAALQATELPKIVDDYLKTINVGTATLDQVQTALTHAQELYTVAQGIVAFNLKGLSTDTLAFFSRGGESLAQTFQRIGGAYSSFVDAFTSPTEKLVNEQKLITETFDALGIAIPGSLKGYRELVQGLDLSTESGRQMFETLLLIAPAFKDVTEAANTTAIALAHRIEQEDRFGHAIDRPAGQVRQLADVLNLIPFGTNAATIYGRSNPSLDRRGIGTGDVRSGTPFGDGVGAANSGLATLQALLGRDPASEALTQASGSAYTALIRQAQALQAQAAAYDGSALATRSLTGATEEYYNAQVNLLTQIEQIRTAVDSMFGDTVRNLTLQTLDNQGKYNFLRDEANTLAGQITNTNDPPELKAIAERINADINQAFGFLDPQSQKAKLSEYIASITAVNEAVKSRLGEIETDVQTTVKEVIEEMRGKLDLVADKFDKAAESNLSAADTYRQASENSIVASRTPIPVALSITLKDDRTIVRQVSRP